MKRKITGFHQDEHNDWVADLDCWHRQHVRHKPPFFNRPWVTSAAGRANMLGTELNCVRCDRLELPAGVVSNGRTPEFTNLTVPVAMLSDHVLPPGIWGQIHVLSGTVIYVVQEPVQHIFTLGSSGPGIIAPLMLHHVATPDDTRFYVEFLTGAGIPGQDL